MMAKKIDWRRLNGKLSNRNTKQRWVYWVDLEDPLGQDVSGVARVHSVVVLPDLA